MKDAGKLNFTEQCYGVAWVPDSLRLVVGGANYVAVASFDPAEGTVREVERARVADLAVRCVCAAPYAVGRSVAAHRGAVCGGFDGTLALFDVRALGREPLARTGAAFFGGDVVNCVCNAPGDSAAEVLAAGRNGAVGVFDTRCFQAGAVVAVPPGSGGECWSVCAGGRTEAVSEYAFCCGFRGGRTVLYDLRNTAGPMWTADVFGGLCGMAFDGEGARVVGGCVDAKVAVVDARSGAVQSSFVWKTEDAKRTGDTVWFARRMGDGSRFCCGRGDGRVGVFNGSAVESEVSVSSKPVLCGDVLKHSFEDAPSYAAVCCLDQSIHVVRLNSD